MSRDINMTFLIGRLTRDPEVRYSNSGTPIAKFSIANNYSYKQGDEFKEEVNFFDVTAFGKQADNIYKFLKKGSLIGIDGELRQNRWQDKTGQGKSKVEIIASSVQFLTPVQSQQEPQKMAEDPWKDA